LFLFFLDAKNREKTFSVVKFVFIEKIQEEKRGAGSSPLGCAKIYRIDDSMLLFSYWKKTVPLYELIY
jgi:hypothetical protein